MTSCDNCEKSSEKAAVTGGGGRTFSRARWSAGRTDVGKWLQNQREQSGGRPVIKPADLPAALPAPPTPPPKPGSVQAWFAERRIKSVGRPEIAGVPDPAPVSAIAVATAPNGVLVPLDQAVDCLLATADEHSPHADPESGQFVRAVRQATDRMIFAHWQEDDLGTLRPVVTMAYRDGRRIHFMAFGAAAKLQEAWSQPYPDAAAAREDWETVGQADGAYFYCLDCGSRKDAGVCPLCD